mgnify:CR=1 FL=1
MEKDLSFSAGIDTKDIEDAGERIKKRLEEIGEKADIENVKIREAFTNLPTVNIEVLSNIDGTLGSIDAAFAEIDRIVDTNKSAIDDLQREYDELGKRMAEAYKHGNDDEYRRLTRQSAAIRENIRLRKQVISETQKAADALSAYEKNIKTEGEEIAKTEVKYTSYRKRIMELKMELINMEQQGQRNTEKYKETQNEVARLTAEWKRATTQATILAHSQKGMQGIISGLSGVSGAFTAAQGAITFFGDKNEDLAKIMVKLQSLMAITMGLQQFQQTLNKNSAFQLVTLNGLREWWNKLLAIGRGEQEAETVATIAGNAAKESSTIATEANAAAQRLKASATIEATGVTGANTAADIANTGAAIASTGANIGLAGSFRMVGAAIKSMVASIPVLGWIAIGITAIYEAYSHFKSKADEATKSIKEQQEMMKNANETYIKTKAGIDDNIRSLEKFNGTQDQEKKLIDDLNSKYGTTLGYHKSRAEWLDILKTKGETYCQMLLMEAQAQAILNKYTEAYINLLEVKGKAESGEYDHWYNTKAGDARSRQAAIDDAQAEVDKWENQYKDLQQQILDFKSKNDLNFHADPNAVKGGGSGHLFDPKKAASETKRIIAEYNSEVKKYIKDANDDIVESIINGQEDGLTKEMNASRRASAKRLEDWENQLRKLAEVRKNAERSIYMQSKGATDDGWLNSDAGRKTTEDYMADLLKDKKIADEYYRGMRVITENGEREIAAIRQRYTDALIDEFGTTQQRMEKLEREWADRLKYIPSEYLDQAIEKMESELSQLQSDDFKNAINWDTIFGDMGKHSTESLRINLERIKAQFEKNKSSMDATEIRNYQEAITKMEDEIASRNPFAALHKAIKDITVSKSEMVSSLSELATTQRDLTTAQAEFDAALEHHREVLEQIDNGELTEDCQELTDATNAETEARNKLSQATAKNTQAENRVIGARNKLTASYRSFATQLKSAGGVVSDIGDRAKNLAGVFSDDLADSIEKGLGFVDEILDATSSVIDAISDVGKGAAKGVEATVEATSQGATASAAAGATAISTIEKASAILAIISAALQVATAIANLFNNDESKQKEIENLQRRIDQLQWELDNQDAVRLQNNIGNAVERLKNIYAQTYAEVARLHAANMNNGTIWQRIVTRQIVANEAYEKSIQKLADAYAKAGYTADKALGNQKYMDSRKQLENLAEQQLLIQKQINAEESKKKTDRGKIEDWKRDIQEIAEQMATIINEMLEDVIGATAEDLAKQLGDAFIEAAAKGEDAMEAWHSKVKEIVADVMRRMLITKFLEEPLGQIFDKYKKKWFGEDGQFKGIDTVIDSMNTFSNDLNQVGEGFQKIWSTLPDTVKDWFTEDVEREGASKGIATASQESVDENNARLTTIQGHTYSIMEGVSELNRTSSMILQSVMSIDKTTKDMDDNLSYIRKDMKNIKNSVDDIQIRGVKLK